MDELRYNLKSANDKRPVSRLHSPIVHPSPISSISSINSTPQQSFESLRVSKSSGSAILGIAAAKVVNKKKQIEGENDEGTQKEKDDKTELDKDKEEQDRDSMNNTFTDSMLNNEVFVSETEKNREGVVCRSIVLGESGSRISIQPSI